MIGVRDPTWSTLMREVETRAAVAAGAGPGPAAAGESGVATGSAGGGGGGGGIVGPRAGMFGTQAHDDATDPTDGPHTLAELLAIARNLRGVVSTRAQAIPKLPQLLVHVHTLHKGTGGGGAAASSSAASASASGSAWGIVQDPSGDLHADFSVEVLAEHGGDVKPGAVLLLRRVTVYTAATGVKTLTVVPDAVEALFPAG